MRVWENVLRSIKNLKNVSYFSLHSYTIVLLRLQKFRVLTLIHGVMVQVVWTWLCFSEDGLSSFRDGLYFKNCYPVLQEISSCCRFKMANGVEHWFGGQSPPSAGWSGPYTFLADSEKDGGTLRWNKEGLNGMCGFFHLAEMEKSMRRSFLHFSRDLSGLFPITWLQRFMF